MSDISAMTSSAVAVSRSQLRENITVNLLRMNAEAEQAVATMVAQQARQIEASSEHHLAKGVNLYA